MNPRIGGSSWSFGASFRTDNKSKMVSVCSGMSGRRHGCVVSPLMKWIFRTSFWVRKSTEIGPLAMLRCSALCNSRYNEHQRVDSGKNFRAGKWCSVKDFQREQWPPDSLCRTVLHSRLTDDREIIDDAFGQNEKIWDIISWDNMAMGVLDAEDDEELFGQLKSSWIGSRTWKKPCLCIWRRVCSSRISETALSEPLGCGKGYNTERNMCEWNGRKVWTKALKMASHQWWRTPKRFANAFPILFRGSRTLARHPDVAGQQRWDKTCFSLINASNGYILSSLLGRIQCMAIGHTVALFFGRFSFGLNFVWRT